MPHAAVEGVTQRRSGWQHPKRQLERSQRVKTQRPSWQSWSAPQASQTPPRAPQATTSVPSLQRPSGSRQPLQLPGTQTPSSQRWSGVQAPQKLFAGPHASMPLLGAHEPSGRQQELTHTQAGGPASWAPASTAGSASQRCAKQRSRLAQRAQASPPPPHSSAVVPSTHSVPEAQQPEQVEAEQGR